MRVAISIDVDASLGDWGLRRADIVDGHVMDLLW
jgi:hypothetical protein